MILSILNEMPQQTIKKDFFKVMDNILLPYTLIKGKQNFPLVLVTAAVHGCEYVGVKATMELAKDSQLKNYDGSILLIHAVNVTGFLQKVTTLVPEDYVNLNRIFQDKAAINTVSYRIKNFFKDNLLPYVNYLIDLHGGNKEEILTPHVYYSLRGQQSVVEQSKLLACVSGSPIIYESNFQGGLYQAAAIDYNIPSILLEQGDNGTCLPQDVFDMKQAVLRVFNYIFKQEIPTTYPEYYQEVFALYSGHLGCWSCFVKPGDKVEKNQFVGQIQNLHGEILEKFYAQESGVVLYQKATLVTYAGESLITVAYQKT